MLERNFQSRIIRRLNTEFEGLIILKNDPNYIQGFPDLTLIYCGRVVLLEVKASKDSKHQPNQDYFIEYLNGFGTPAFFIYPENEEEVFNEIHKSFRT